MFPETWPEGQSWALNPGLFESNHCTILPSILIILIVSREINHCFQLTEITLKLGEFFCLYCNSSFLQDNAFKITQENILYENESKLQGVTSQNTDLLFFP